MDFSLTNSEFDFPFGDKVYKIKKANLEQVIEFQRDADEITKKNDPSGDLLMAAKAIYLALKKVDDSITEEYVLQNTSGEVDVVEVLSSLGFMNQRKVAVMTKVRNALETPSPSGGKSSE